MADRIRDMRSALQTALVARDSTRDWSHITSQIGMFAFTGLTKEQVLAMRERFHIYCTLDGRISVGNAVGLRTYAPFFTGRRAQFGQRRICS